VYLHLAEKSVDEVVPEVKLLQRLEAPDLREVKLSQQIVVQRESMNGPQRSQGAVELGDFVVAQSKLIEAFTLQKLILVELK
jgi:hypothetical protein